MDAQDKKLITIDEAIEFIIACRNAGRNVYYVLMGLNYILVIIIRPMSTI